MNENYVFKWQILWYKKMLILSTEKTEFEHYLKTVKFEELRGTIEQLVKKAP